MRFAAVALAMLLLAGPVAGQERTTDPWAGLSDADLERLATEIRSGRDAKATAAAQAALIRELMAQIEEQQTTIAELKDAEGKRAVAVAIAEDRDQRRQENEAVLLRIVEQYRGLLDESGKINERQMKQIDALQTQQKWMLFGGVIGLAAMAIFLGL